MGVLGSGSLGKCRMQNAECRIGRGFWLLVACVLMSVDWGGVEGVAGTLD